VSEFLSREQASIKADSQSLAKQLKHKTVIAYVENRIGSVALRPKQADQ
jgi:hypothetical protein